MSGFLKTSIRFAVIGSLLMVGAAVVLAPGRVRSACSRVSEEVHSLLQDEDGRADPASLRRELRELDREYPEKITSVRSDLAQLDRQIRGLERRQALAARVVAIASEELATGARARQAAHIHRAQAVYSAQVEDTQREASYLKDQRVRLVELLDRLENEYAEYKAQVFMLERQIESVARNERIIDLLEKRNQTLEELGQLDVNSLEQIRGRLADILTRQEAELELLGETGCVRDFEREARASLRSDTSL